MLISFHQVGKGACYVIDCMDTLLRQSKAEEKMAESQVYYMDAHSESTETALAAKMITVFDAAGLDEMIEPNDIVAIKVHCGEWNNSA